MAIKNPGRPGKGEPERVALRTVSFCADDATIKVLVRLERALGVGPLRGRRSQVVRRALHDAAARLPPK